MKMNRSALAIVLALGLGCSPVALGSGGLVSLDRTRIEAIAIQAIKEAYAEREQPSLQYRGINITSDTNDTVRIVITYVDLGSHIISSLQHNRMIISDSRVSVIPVSMDQNGDHVTVGSGEQQDRESRRLD